MECMYCGAANSEEEHRCERCGRRLGTGNVAPAVRSVGSALPAREAAAVITLPKREPLPRPPQQQSLFRVIPFEGIAQPPKPEDVAANRSAPKRNVGLLPAQTQERLPFAQEEETEAPLARLCQGEVAGYRVRIVAALFDLAVVLSAAGLFLGVFAWWTGGMPFDRSVWWIYGAALGLIVCFYRLLGGVFSGRSPGMRYAGLRLLRLDGKPVTRARRLFREPAVLLSLLPAGFGFLWALVDDERLTFHDHISETFSSPVPSSR